MSRNDGGPAFPVGFAPDGSPSGESAGMSLRDWFAGQALAGMLANTGITDLYRAADANAAQRKVSDAAYEIAGAMLSAREQGGGR